MQVKVLLKKEDILELKIVSLIMANSEVIVLAAVMSTPLVKILKKIIPGTQGSNIIKPLQSCLHYTINKTHSFSRSKNNNEYYYASLSRRNFLSRSQSGNQYYYFSKNNKKFFCKSGKY